MKIIEATNYQDLSRKAANIISAQIILKPNCVLGLATGSSPIGTYKQLIDWYNKGDIDFSQVKSVNLDEYMGLAPDNPQSYYYFMYENFFKHINIDLKKVHIPNGMEEDIEKECSHYDQLISSLGGVDLQLLGLGNNGHIGFNEPYESFNRTTHCVELAQSTIEANARFFKTTEEIPRYAYTMGIGNIMNANRIILIVSGSEKAQILKEVIEGAILPSIPASILQLHKDITVIADKEAASLLTK